MCGSLLVGTEAARSSTGSATARRDIVLSAITLEFSGLEVCFCELRRADGFPPGHRIGCGPQAAGQYRQTRLRSGYSQMARNPPEYQIRGKCWTSGQFSLPITGYVTSYFLTARLAARRMVANKSGVIMTISALPARTGTRLNGGYGAASAAKEALTRDLSAELAVHGIRVVALRPHGMPETSTTKAPLFAADGYLSIRPAVPSGLAGTVAGQREHPSLAIRRTVAPGGKLDRERRPDLEIA